MNLLVRDDFVHHPLRLDAIELLVVEPLERAVFPDDRLSIGADVKVRAVSINNDV